MGLSCRSCLSLSSSSLCSFVLAIFQLLSFAVLPAAFAMRSANNETDRLALLEFKDKIADDPLGMMSSWNSSLHFCQWHGVTCGRRHQRVTMLDLGSLKLSGSISPYVGNLSFLRKLYLENNSFSHDIPPQSGHLRRLQILSLYNNSFGGEIPPNISACSNLVYLYLDGNKLVGKIPSQLTSLMKLKEFFFGRNNLIGTIPPSLGNLSSLWTLSGDTNKLHGVLPESLGRLTNLKYLALFENRFSGTIPSSVFNISSIVHIDVEGNHLQGTLPMSLGISLPQLQFISISSNQFTGSIPTSISNASNLANFEISANNLTGNVPSLEKLNNLSFLSIGLNHLGSGRADDLKFLADLTNATALQILNIGMDNFGGKLPENIANLSKKLEIFFINNNQLHGNIPAGIEVLVNLNFLYASWNKFSGTIPSSIGKLKNLRELYLNNNNFLGNIPSSLANLTNLLEIYFSYNNLQGMIPSSLANCTSLLALDLSNNILTGPIPRNLFELSYLSKFLDLSANRLHGSLPNEVGNLKQLGILALQENMLSGEIPSDLGSCASLEQLDISHNFFRGSIPSSLSMIPIEGIFKKASAISIEGNLNLCGGIRDFGLPACESEQPKTRLTVKLKIIISVASALVGGAFVFICLFLWRSRMSEAKPRPSSFENAILRLSYQSLLKATNDFSSDNLIGSGGCGYVYKGILDQDGSVIAVKVLNLMHRGAAKSFLAECKVLRNVRHRNLVKVLTACSGIDYHGNDFKALVYEFIDNGSLDDWLHPRPLRSDEVPRTLNVLHRLNISIDVACALEYLHCHSGTPIIHCDLKPSNVLLNKEMTGHVSDFGLAKFLSDEKLNSAANHSSSVGARGTIGYCPPEYGLGSDVSTSGDIFSFGVLVLEMFTGKRPTDDMFKEGLTLHNFVKNALSEQVIEVVDCKILQMQTDATTNRHPNLRSRRNNKLIECLIAIFEIGICCSSELPRERMNIDDVVVQLSSIRNKFLGT
ncbi:serine-threonine protein kinase, plant-type, putative [Ricinus communis]|uniref:non-specific serine/threonine protein kinase n=1 Tax=Ricinus communis TaxID=3988 RepID=B9SS82_RICCO|nr:serine-threonine protein kinase, plant-type, putative [Ricinus communis]